MIIFFEIITFLVFSFFVFYIPGKFLIERLKLKFGQPEGFVIGILLGIFSFVLISIFARLFGLSFVLAILAHLTFDILYFRKIKISNISDFFINAKKLFSSNVLLLLVLAIGIISQSWIHFNSAINSTAGISFPTQPFHDAVFHLSFIGELKNHFPPQNPLFAGAPLKNYHYLTDFLIAGISSVLPFSLFNLYFRLLPIFISLYYGLAAYALVSKFTTEKWTRNLAVFFAYFVGPFTYFIPLFKSGPWSANSFMLDQPFDFSFNSQSLFSLVLLFIGFLLICEYKVQKNKNLIYLSAIVFSASFGFKSFVSILGIIAFLNTSIYTSLLKRDFNFLKGFVLGILIFIASFFLLVNNFNNGLRFSPGWTLKRMVEDSDRLYLPDLTLREQHYQSKGNVLRIAQINIEEILIYTFGNLGIRTIGFLYLIFYLRKPFNIPTEIVFGIAIVLSGLFIPITFNLGESAYNIIQFGVYSLAVLSIFSAVAIENIRKKVMFLKNQLPFLGLIIILIILAIPANIKTFIERANYSRFLISQDELLTIDFLKANSTNSSVILLYPSNTNNSYAYISALSGRKVFLSDRVMVEIMGLPFLQREKQAYDFFHEMTQSEQKDFLVDKNIDYIYLTKEALKELENTNRLLSFKPIFQSGYAVLYKIYED